MLCSDVRDRAQVVRGYLNARQQHLASIGADTSTPQPRVKIKCGHGGTLDPMATGVLVLGIGGATKTLTTYLQGAKGYYAGALLGSETGTKLIDLRVRCNFDAGC